MNHPKYKLASLAFMLAALPCASAAPAACQYEVLTAKGSQIQVGELRIDLGEADDPAQPQAWQGPLTTATCSLEVGIIENPIALSSNQLLLVSTYSGSSRMLVVVDPRACAILWKSAPLSRPIEIGKHTLTLEQQRLRAGANCLPTP